MTMKPEIEPVGIFTKILWGGMAIVCGLVILAFLIPVAIFFLAQEVEVSDSPKGYGTSYFHKVSGFLDTTIELYVKDKSLSSDKISVGHVSDAGGQGEPPERAVWSRDGTVIAVNRGQNRPTPEIEWSHAYDFLHHKNFWSETLQVDPKRSMEISKLLAERGGEGMVLIPKSENTNMYSRTIFPWDGFK